VSNLSLPRQLKNNNLFIAFADFLSANPQLPKEITIDFRDVQFITPPNVAFLSNFIHWFENAGIAVSLENLDVSRKVLKYLDDALFFESHLGHKLCSTSELRATTLPVLQLKRTDSHWWLEHTFLPWLNRTTGLSIASLAEIKTCVQELINNISDHTIHDEGCIFGQWYPQKNEIIVSIADFGIGIPVNIRKVEADINDCAAIIKAAEDGFSTKSILSNRGAGLYLLLLNVVLRFNGKVTIRSQSGYVRFEKRGGILYPICNRSCGFCVGTTIDLVISTDHIPPADDEEEFEWT
jgi:anti-sigma regulatory factor (Ser/Thr protein kinase)